MDGQDARDEFASALILSILFIHVQSLRRSVNGSGRSLPSFPVDRAVYRLKNSEKFPSNSNLASRSIWARVNR